MMTGKGNFTVVGILLIVIGVFLMLQGGLQGDLFLWVAGFILAVIAAFLVNRIIFYLILILSAIVGFFVLQG